MVEKKLVFEVDGIRTSITKSYKEEPTKEQVLNDIKEWFFERHCMWFAVKEDDVESNLEDWLNV